MELSLEFIKDTHTLKLNINGVISTSRFYLKREFYIYRKRLVTFGFEEIKDLSFEEFMKKGKVIKYIK